MADRCGPHGDELYAVLRYECVRAASVVVHDTPPNDDGAGGVVAPQFAPTAIVGAGVEFNGTWSYAPLNQIWNVALDIDASTFTISFNDVGLNSSSDISGATFLGLQLSDLDFGSDIIGVTVLASDGAAVQSIGFTPRGVTVNWNVFQFRDASGNPLPGGNSTFSIQTAAVPEPASGALAALGLLAMAVLRKRNRTAGQRCEPTAGQRPAG